MKSAERLNVNANRLWEKVRPVILQESFVESPELRAQRLLRSNVLSEGELALLVLAGIDHLMGCLKTKGEVHEYPLLRN